MQYQQYYILELHDVDLELRQVLYSTADDGDCCWSGGDYSMTARSLD